MIRKLLVIGAAALLGLGVVAGWFGSQELRETETETVVETTTETATDTTTSTPDSGLPAAVEETRAALLEAAESGSYEALRPLLPTSGGFEYTFGGPVEGGPIAYWQQLERDTDERPLETLAAILRMPYVLTRGTYVWPWAYTVESADDLSEHERGLLAPLGPPSRLFVEGTGYLSWRTGINPDGTWAFFIAGD